MVSKIGKVKKKKEDLNISLKRIKVKSLTKIKTEILEVQKERGHGEQ